MQEKKEKKEEEKEKEEEEEEEIKKHNIIIKIYICKTLNHHSLLRLPNFTYAIHVVLVLLYSQTAYVRKAGWMYWVTNYTNKECAVILYIMGT